MKRFQCGWAMAAGVATLVFGALPLRAEWIRGEQAIGWAERGETVWEWSFSRNDGKPAFRSLRAVGGPELLAYRPDDHPWHYGLWFSWKYINGVNYWEENRATGRSVGLTRWRSPQIETWTDGSARIRLELDYVNPSGRVDMTESRTLVISPPDKEGGYTIDWRSRFIAGPEGAVLDRTPMPGEPNGAVNGGYAGLGLRLVPQPARMTVVSSEGDVTRFEHERARPAAAAVACNLSEETGATTTGIAIVSDPVEVGEKAPWYVINGGQMRFVCAAILAPKVRTLPAGGDWTLRYRIAIRRGAWTPDALRAMTRE
jgi:hypothetical protein